MNDWVDINLAIWADEGETFRIVPAGEILTRLIIYNSSWLIPMAAQEGLVEPVCLFTGD